MEGLRRHRSRLAWALVLLAALYVREVALEADSIQCQGSEAYYYSDPGYACSEVHISGMCEFVCAACGSSGTQGGACAAYGGGYRLHCFCEPIIED